MNKSCRVASVFTSLKKSDGILRKSDGTSDLLGVYYQQLRPTTEPTALMSPDQTEPDQVRPVDIPQVPSGQQLSQLSNQSGKGEGVGLQIVKHLCELLDASMDVESIKDRGTLFRVRMAYSFRGGR